MKDIVVTLYYANWCGHCKDFKPEWNLFASVCNNKELNYEIKHTYNVSLSCREYEESKNPKEIEFANVN